MNKFPKKLKGCLKLAEGLLEGINGFLKEIDRILEQVNAFPWKAMDSIRKSMSCWW